MKFFNKLLNKEESIKLNEIEINDDEIIAPADGELIDIHTVKDPVFAQEIMGKGVAFRYFSKKIIMCSPANGTLTAFFPTGHAYGITMKNGTEILVHCGIETVRANGKGFRLFGKKQYDRVKAGEPVVEVNIEELSKNYDMSTMLIIVNANGQRIDFIEPQLVKRGQLLTK